LPALYSVVTWLIAVFVLALAAMGARRTQRIVKARDAARKAPIGTLMETTGIGTVDHGGFPSTRWRGRFAAGILNVLARVVLAVQGLIGKKI
jgi:hypothetical protein